MGETGGSQAAKAAARMVAAEMMVVAVTGAEKEEAVTGAEKEEAMVAVARVAARVAVERALARWVLAAVAEGIRASRPSTRRGTMQRASRCESCR